jgi:HKD family nuclease
MKFLATPSDIEPQLRRLLRSSAKLRMAVAWAGYDFPLAKLLLDHRSKIEQLTVGIHFYQTHPDFIASVMGLDGARFVMNPDGVFHPKLYYFEHANGDWECVTGSPNFTKGAFSQNTEVAVLIGSGDAGAADARVEILA